MLNQRCQILEMRLIICMRSQMSEHKLEKGDVWESDFYEEMIIDVISNVCCKAIVRNKRNGNFSYETTCIRDLQIHYNYKGKAVNPPSDWFKVYEEAND